MAGSAKERLQVPPGRLPCEHADAFRRFLKVETQRLKILHRGGASGSEVCRRRAEMMDVLLRHAFDAYLAFFTTQGIPREPLCVVALGGYGRSELNPHSDVDIVLLHDRHRGGPSPLLKAVMVEFNKFPGDTGFDCLPLVRDLDDCVRVANEKMESKTALLEARLVWGDARLFEQMRVVVADHCLKGREDAYIADRLKNQEERRAKWGNAFCLLEPHVKNGCGGLRDYQSLRWMATVKHRVRDLSELVDRGQLSAGDHRLLEKAYDFLLRVRNELHYQVPRKSDVLTRALQPAVAYQLGYHERGLAKRVESFLADYYQHVRNLHLITRNLERRLALRPPGRLRSLGRLLRRSDAAVDGFRIKDGELLGARPDVFQEKPLRLMRAFLVAQQNGLVLHPDLEDRIRQDRRLVNAEFLADPRVHETFLEILNHRGGVARIVRAMHDTDFLGQYIPAFRRITCCVQLEFFHVYTTDEHTLVCLEMLDRIWDSPTPPFKPYHEIFRSIDRPYILYLALLLHDVGKAAKTKDHAADSTRFALTQTRRLSLPVPASATVAFLVRNHLLMTRLSQKLDLDDPEVIREFAATVQTPEQLNLLTLHTFADSMGTSETLWTPFKESLLWTLHRRAERVLAGTAESRAAGPPDLAPLEHEVCRLLPAEIDADEVAAHFRCLPERYFSIHAAREIASDIQLVHRFMERCLLEDGPTLQPVVHWHAEPDRGYVVVKLCTWDRPGLFSRIAGALAAIRLNILNARLFSRDDIPTLDTLFINDPARDRLPGREAREEFESLLARVFGEPNFDLEPLISRHRPSPSPFAPPALEQLPTRISFDNSLVRQRTVVTVDTEDRVGLLYDLTRAFAELQLDIGFARIATERGVASDTFHLSDMRTASVHLPHGTRILGTARQQEIEARLRAILAKAPGPTPAAAASRAPS